MDLKCPSQPCRGSTNHGPLLVQVFPPVSPGELNDGDKKGRKTREKERTWKWTLQDCDRWLRSPQIKQPIPKVLYVVMGAGFCPIVPSRDAFEI